MKPLYNILLIEPDVHLANTIQEWLKGKTNIISMGVREALSACQLNKINVIIGDVKSGNTKTMKAICSIKKANNQAFVVVLTEQKNTEFILSAMASHVDAMLFKPLEKKEFIKKIISLAEESRINKDKSRKRILAIGAHPDDIELGCAGTLLKLAQEGHDINFLTLSLGARGGDPNIRKKEAEKAASLLGANLYWGNYSDTEIAHSTETISFISSIVTEVNPTHIYTHSEFDTHQDHQSIYYSTVTASRYVPNLYCYLSPSSTVDFKPNAFITIDDYLNKKIEIIASFASQSDIRPYLKADMIRATARYWGRFCNYALVEPMVVIKEAF